MGFVSLGLLCEFDRNSADQFDIVRPTVWQKIVGVAILVISGLISSWVIYERYTRVDQAAVEFHAAEFESALARNDLKKVIQEARQFEMIAHKTDPRWDWILARMNLANNEPEEAIRHFQKVPAESPHAATARLTAGQLLLRAGRLMDAEKQLLQAIELKPEMVSARLELIHIYSIQSRRLEIRRLFGEISWYKPLDAENLLHWTLTLGNNWSPREDEAELKKYVEITPADKWTRLALARCLNRQKKTDEALAILQYLGDADPEALAIRVAIAIDRGETEVAARLLESAPDGHLDLTIEKAKFLFLRNDALEAKKRFEIAVQMDPEDRDAIYGLSRALTLLGQKEESKKWIKRSDILQKLEMMLRDISKQKGGLQMDQLKSFAVICEELGHPEIARGWWSVIAAADPANEEAGKALYRLGPLRPSAR